MEKLVKLEKLESGLGKLEEEIAEAINQKKQKTRKINVTLEIKRYKSVIDKLLNEKIITDEEYKKCKEVHQTSILRWIGLNINDIEVNV